MWLFGSPRSGSTWLLNLLTHPLRSDDESETGIVRLAAEGGGEAQAIPINEPYVPQHLAPALADELVLNDALPAVSLPAMRRASPNYFLSDRFADVWEPRLRRLVLARMRAQARLAAAEHGIKDPLLVVKEPNGSLGADFVMSLLSRSRLIFLLRDGRDVVDSMVAARSPGGWLEPYSTEIEPSPSAVRLSVVHKESSLWVARTRVVKRAYDAHPPQLRCLVRYEQLRADPGEVLAGIDGWLGLRRDAGARADAIRWNDFDSIPSEAKGPGMPLRAAQPGLWRRNLSAAEQEVMHEVLGATLAEVGYEQ